jgi:hypothetical protein
VHRVPGIAGDRPSSTPSARSWPWQRWWESARLLRGSVSDAIPVMGSSVVLTATTDSMGFLIFLGLAAIFLV